MHNTRSLANHQRLIGHTYLGGVFLCMYDCRQNFLYLISSNNIVVMCMDDLFSRYLVACANIFNELKQTRRIMILAYIKWSTCVVKTPLIKQEYHLHKYVNFVVISGIVNAKRCLQHTLQDVQYRFCFFTSIILYMTIK